MKISVDFSIGFTTLVLVFTAELVTGEGCNSNPCQNGFCFDLSSGEFICSCFAGFTGATCERAEGEPICQDDTCANGGTCNETDIDFQCQCTSMFTGRRCESPKNISITTAFTATMKSSTPSTPATLPTSVKPMPKTTTEPSSVDLWIIIAIAVAATVVVILVVIIICVIVKGKNSSDKFRGTSNAPNMIADFSNNADQNDRPPSPDYESAHHNSGYNDEDSPPPSYHESNFYDTSSFDDHNQPSHINNFDNYQHSYEDDVNTFDEDFKFDMY